MHHHLVALAAAGLVYASAAVPLFGQDGPPNPTDSQGPAAAEASDRDKIVCRTNRPPTGTRVSNSRTRSKTCMTKADWEIQEREAQDQARMASQEGRYTVPNGNTPPPK